jgi:hypothetical protein
MHRLYQKKASPVLLMLMVLMLPRARHHQPRMVESTRHPSICAGTRRTRPHRIVTDPRALPDACAVTGRHSSQRALADWLSSWRRKRRGAACQSGLQLARAAAVAHPAGARPAARSRSVKEAGSAKGARASEASAALRGCHTAPAT